MVPSLGNECLLLHLQHCQFSYRDKTMQQSWEDKEKQLVLALKGGDQLALKTLYGLYSGKLYHYSLKICKSPALAEDVVQDVFIKIWEKRASLNADHAFQSFLFTITRNRLLDLIKRAARESEIFSEIARHMPSGQRQVEQKLAYQECNTLVQQAINKLPNQRQLIFRLSREEGLTYAEIAQRLGITKGTVNIQIVKALKSIRDYLDMKEAEIFVCLLLLFL